MNNSYQLIPNANVRDMICGSLDDLKVGYQVTTINMPNTKTQWRLLLDETMLVNGDEVSPQIIVTNAERVGTALRIGLGMYRFVCTNGLFFGDDMYSTKIIHRIGDTFERKYGEVSHQIAAAVDYARHDYAESVEEKTNMSLDSDDTVISIIGNLNLPKSVKDKSLRSWYSPLRIEDKGTSVWELLNVVNESIAYEVPSHNARITYNKNLLRDMTDLLIDIKETA